MDQTQAADQDREQVLDQEQDRELDRAQAVGLGRAQAVGLGRESVAEQGQEQVLDQEQDQEQVADQGQEQVLDQEQDREQDRAQAVGLGQELARLLHRSKKDQTLPRYRDWLDSNQRGLDSTQARTPLYSSTFLELDPAQIGTLAHSYRPSLALRLFHSRAHLQA